MSDFKKNKQKNGDLLNKEDRDCIERIKTNRV